MTTLLQTVLYVEDECTDAFFMRRAFEKAGLGSAFQTVEHGRAAVEYLAGAGVYSNRAMFPVPKVVLLDLNLPEMSGFEVLQWIRNRPEYTDLTVVIFSSSAREEDRATAKRLRANDYWSKPISTSQLDPLVQQLRERWLEADPISIQAVYATHQDVVSTQ